MKALRVPSQSSFVPALLLVAGWITLLAVLYYGLLVSWGVPRPFMGTVGFDLYHSGWVVWRLPSFGTWSLALLLQFCNALLIVWLMAAALNSRLQRDQREAADLGIAGSLVVLVLSHFLLWSIGSRTPSTELKVVPVISHELVSGDEGPKVNTPAAQPRQD